MDQRNSGHFDPQSRVGGGYSSYNGRRDRSSFYEDDAFDSNRQSARNKQTTPEIILSDECVIVKKKQRNALIRALLWIGAAITFARNLFFNIIFLLLIFVIIGGFLAAGLLKNEIDGLLSGNAAYYETVGNNGAEVLYFDLSGYMSEAPLAATGFPALQREFSDSLNGTVSHEITAVEKALRLSATDPAIKKIIICTDGMDELTLSAVERIGSAVDAAKSEDREIVVIGSEFSQAAYALAAHADHIVMDPLGSIDFKGISMSSLFFKDLLAKAGVTPYVFRAGHFKSAVEPFIMNSMSYDVKKEYEAIAFKSWALYRKTLLRRKNIVNQGILPDAQTYTEWLRRFDGDRARLQLAEGFVDELTAPETYFARLAKEVRPDPDDPLKPAVITYKDYLMSYFVRNNGTDIMPYSMSNIILPQSEENAQSAARIEVIYGIGEIKDTTNRQTDFTPDNLITLLDQARLDPDVKAVVLYLNSPGGSVTASEKIRRSVEQLQSTGKKVIVSMNGTAASGAYWIACQADRIFATPTTITGSIGVFGIGLGAHKLLNDFGAYQDGVSTNELAKTPIAEKMPESRQQIMSMSVASTYSHFLKLVSDRRKLDPLAYPRYAEGQIFHADSAQELGLIDEVGTLDDAVAAAKQSLGTAGANLKVVHVSPDSLISLSLLDKAVLGFSVHLLPDGVTKDLLDLYTVAKEVNADPDGMKIKAISPVSEPKL